MTEYKPVETEVQGKEMGAGLEVKPEGSGAESKGVGGEREHGNPLYSVGRVVEKRKGEENDFIKGEKSCRTSEDKDVDVLTTSLGLDQTQTGRGKSPCKEVTLNENAEGKNVLVFDEKLK